MAEDSGLSLEFLTDRLRASGSVFAEEEAALLHSSFHGPDLDEALLLRMAGTPLEHLLGWVEFAGLRLQVARGVFVPRQRTVWLVEHALAELPRHGVLVELCCGVAPVASAVATARRDVTVYASDVDPTAVECARDNLAAFGASVYVGSLASGLPDTLTGSIDVVVANAPYVPTTQIALMPPEARDHEPLVALDGGADGARIQAAVARDARRLLKPGGVLLVETAKPLAEVTAAELHRAGYLVTISTDEELMATCVVGRRPPQA